MMLDEDNDRKKETDAIYQGKPFCLAQQFILTSVPFRILSDKNFFHSHSTQTLDHNKGNKIKSNFFLLMGIQVIGDIVKYLSHGIMILD